MSTEIKMSGFVSAECAARNIGDLRVLLEWCDKYGISDDAGLDWGYGKVYVELTGDSAVPASWIECGDHLVGDEHWDVLIDTHTHKYNGPETYEEAREEALERKPAKYDWPAKDRYGDERMPG